jgi:capsular polysaccharide biosynthesis protein
MTVTIAWSDPEQAQTIAEAVGAAVADGGAEYFPQLTGVKAQAVLIDGPGIAQVGRSLQQKLDLPIRLFLALLAGIALAVFLDYVDDTIRDRSEIESMGVQVLGEIPRRRGLHRRIGRS